MATGGCSDSRTISAFFGIIIAAASGLACIFYLVMLTQWIGAEYKADIINREYGTQYTQAEVFYASDVIETVRHLHRQRVEIKADVTGGSK